MSTAEASARETPGAVVSEILHAAVAARLESCAKRPFILGLCGAQGSGKSTAASALRRRFEAEGVRAAVLSLDDLYLPREARLRLAQAVHPLLATRGPPGTHEVGLGERVLDALAQPGAVRLPRFDKAADTRLPEAAWDRLRGPADLIIFEGWCVGALPQPAADLAEPVNALEQEEDPDGAWRRWVNDRLAGDYQHLFARLDMLALLAAPDVCVVSRWRAEQEHALAAQEGSTGHRCALMSDAQVARFVQHYERLTRHILAEMPERADLLIRLDAQRTVLSSEAKNWMAM